MDENPYQPPKAKLSQQALDKRTRSGVLAVIVGALVDIIGTTIATTVLVFGYLFLVAEKGVATESVEKMTESDGFLILGTVIGLMCTALGGYVTARMANHREYHLAFIMGIVSLAVAETSFLLESGTPPIGLRVMGDLLTIPAALCGAYLKLRWEAPPVDLSN